VILDELMDEFQIRVKNLFSSLLQLREMTEGRQG